jgi:hypothetical protein
MTRMNKLLTLSVWILGAVSLPSAEETGTITGKIDKPAAVTAVTLVNRADDKKFPAKLDAATGKFAVTGLPVGATYDCIIDFGKARLEGVNFKVPKHDFDTDEELPLAKEDADKITKTIGLLNEFEDKVEVMSVTGNVQHAVVLVNKLRTRAFIGSKDGEVIWRLEVWRFEKPDETWIKVQDELFLVLYRERIQKADFDKKALTLDPTLGGLKLTEKQKAIDLGTIALAGTEAGIRLRMPKKDK